MLSSTIIAVFLTVMNLVSPSLTPPAAARQDQKPSVATSESPAKEYSVKERCERYTMNITSTALKDSRQEPRL